tara:strand:+ start:1965 stop:2225 length:261 start_codon:yes stop_codon:yes gene_type:complete
MNRYKVLGEASDLINGDREIEHGQPRHTFRRTAKMWSGYLCQDISPSDVCVMMVLLKAARLRHKLSDDSFIDMAGYAALGSEVSSD